MQQLRDLVSAAPATGLPGLADLYDRMEARFRDELTPRFALLTPALSSKPTRDMLLTPP
jgi:hypothetical protein